MGQTGGYRSERARTARIEEHDQDAADVVPSRYAARSSTRGTVADTGGISLRDRRIAVATAPAASTATSAANTAKRDFLVIPPACQQTRRPATPGHIRTVLGGARCGLGGKWLDGGVTTQKQTATIHTNRGDIVV
ncbi:hypothetical protein GORHZ_063_00070, partial [Gordonia rhizosphera NBRC 16068]